MKKMKFTLLALAAVFSFLISSCNNSPVNPNNPNTQNIIDSLGIDTNNTNCSFNYAVTYDSTTNVYTFNGQGSGVSPIQYVWVIGQDTLYGQTISVQGPVTDFCAAMLDGAGCFTSICDSVSNGNNNGTCSTTFTSTVDTTNNSIVLVASGTGVAPYTYAWDINGTSYTGANITIPVTGSGNYLVCLTQTDGSGCTATYCDSVSAFNNPVGNCGVTAYAYTDSTGNNMVTATANATGVAPYTYAWTVNGTSYVGQTITWQGQSGMTYQACVTVADNNGCTSTDCTAITIP
jgi:hypothetical protein